MKKLTILRHAKSGWEDPVARDFDRPLNERGRRAATVMGAYLARTNTHFDTVISSPAVRCTETLDALWEGMGTILHPNWDRRIYLASSDTLLDVLKELPVDVSSALLCGHNPGCEELSLLLMSAAMTDDRHEIEEKFPTGSICEIAFDVADWADIRPYSGQCTRFMRPRDIDPALGPERRG